MCRHATLLLASSLALLLGMVSSAKQQVKLSESYLPVAMQVIAHLTDQMAFESKDEPAPAKPAKPIKPTTQPPKPLNDWQKPTAKPPSSWPQKPTQKPTSKPPSSWPKPTSKPPLSWPPYTTKAPSTPANSWGSWTTYKPYVAISDAVPASGPKPPASGPKPPTIGPKPPASGPKPPTSGSKPTAPVISPINFWLTLPASGAQATGSSKPTFPVLPPPPVLGTKPSVSGWWMNYGLLIRYSTTPFHRPGFYAPLPPKPHERFQVMPKGEYLPPIDHNSQYTVIEPQETRSETLLALENEEQEVQPLIDPAQDTKLLPPSFEDDEAEKVSRTTDTEDPENLQYLSEGVQQMIRMANDPDDERLVDVWEGLRGANNQEITPKGKLSSSNLRLLLLYDLLSREAKRLKLSDYSGFSPDVLRKLSETSSGGARAQLSFALSKMVERKDCEHEYANNRAKEMVQELAKDESKLSSEIRYLQPLVYNI